jgi:4,5-DOPA dioxygenase extradiol
MLPTLFLSHGSPMIALQDSPARRFLVDYGATLPRPRAIVVASAHFETPMPVVSTDPAPEMIYDFGNFDPRLFEIVYPAPGAPNLAMAVAQRLQAAGLSPRVTPKRGYDHGTWIPLALMYPDADIPVVQVSIQPNADPAHHLAVGRALAGLAEENVLVIGSGSLTHNLGEVFDRRRGGFRPLEGPIDAWAVAFSDWFAEKIAGNDVAALVDYRRQAPEAVRNHPHDDHLLPLYVALGAAGEGARPDRIHTSGQHGSLMMDAYAWWPKAEPSRAAA